MTMICPSPDPVHHHHLTYLRVDQNKLKEPISSYIFFCFPRIHSIYYGEQRSTNGETIQLKTQVFRSYQEEEEEDDHDSQDNTLEGQEVSDEHYNSHYYEMQEWQDTI